MLKVRVITWAKNLAALATIIVFLIEAPSTWAATMTLQSSAAKVEAGNLFTVRVYVNSQSIYINNAEATINFPNDLLDVVSIDSKSSIFSMWVDPPAFSNTNGTVTFNGGVTNPGYNGSGGQLLGVVFKAKKAGVASIFFSGPAVKANDGLGTDVLSDQNSVDVTINGPATSPAPVTPPPAPTETPVKTELPITNRVVVTSPTAPNQNAWYNTNDITVTWTNLSNASAVQVLLSGDPTVTPNKTLPPDTQSRTINNIDDGISYFLIREKTSQGWSGVTAYKLQIDTAVPHSLSVAASANPDGSTKLSFSASDDTSGVRNYSFSIDGATPVVTAENFYNLKLAPGKYDIVLTATDQAGNQAEYRSEITTEASSAPTIANYSPKVNFGDSIYAAGQSPYPNANLNVSVRTVYGVVTDYDVQTDSAGKFIFRSEPQKTSGDYEIWASVVNADGTKGPSSERVKIYVTQNSPWINRVAKVIFSTTVLVALLVQLLAIAAGIGWYKFLILHWHYNQLKKHLEELEAQAEPEAVEPEVAPLPEPSLDVAVKPKKRKKPPAANR